MTRKCRNRKFASVTNLQLTRGRFPCKNPTRQQFASGANPLSFRSPGIIPQQSPMLKFRADIYVFAPEVDRIVTRVDASRAKSLIETGRAEVKERRGKLVCEIRLLVCNLPMSALNVRAGSFGIRREPLENGNTLFQHHSVMPRLRTAA